MGLDPALNLRFSLNLILAFWINLLVYESQQKQWRGLWTYEDGLSLEVKEAWSDTVAVYNTEACFFFFSFFFFFFF